MVDPHVNPTACWEFKGEILVLHHPTTISPKYQAMGELSVSHTCGIPLMGACDTKLRLQIMYALGEYLISCPSLYTIQYASRYITHLCYTGHIVCTCICPITVHSGSTRQTASILSMDRELLRTGDKATCLFRFIKYPEYLRPDTRMVFREGRTKAVGSITTIIPHIPGEQSM